MFHRCFIVSLLLTSFQYVFPWCSIEVHWLVLLSMVFMYFHVVLKGVSLLISITFYGFSLIVTCYGTFSLSWRFCGSPATPLEATAAPHHRLASPWKCHIVVKPQAAGFWLVRFLLGGTDRAPSESMCNKCPATGRFKTHLLGRVSVYRTTSPSGHLSTARNAQWPPPSSEKIGAQKRCEPFQIQVN